MMQLLAHTYRDFYDSTTVLIPLLDGSGSTGQQTTCVSIIPSIHSFAEKRALCTALEGETSELLIFVPEIISVNRRERKDK